ncbi:MAG TPA: hypothetical protein VGX25_19245 [Actinophytocola sp.]|uniref:hypothetical protein n=1 Tax=Actinophytocola sp. TaxID=1872138 RepID=UPI002DDD9911|nr:hypothetical protein [Actinophytocola sp.]HEV2781524.1 hypothetical protein [Actinophytocola sp.]
MQHLILRTGGGDNVRGVVRAYRPQVLDPFPSGNDVRKIMTINVDIDDHDELPSQSTAFVKRRLQRGAKNTDATDTGQYEDK